MPVESKIDEPVTVAELRRNYQRLWGMEVALKGSTRNAYALNCFVGLGFKAGKHACVPLRTSGVNPGVG